MVPFGTNLLRVIRVKIVPEDTEGVTHANLELQRQIHIFPGLSRYIEPLRGWGDRILLLFNDLGRLSNSDQNSPVCPQIELLLMTYNIQHPQLPDLLDQVFGPSQVQTSAVAPFAGSTSRATHKGTF